jgi:F1F0 ATPase subunit 2
MNEMVMIILYFLAGAAIGVVYFGGLWWTLRRLGRCRKPHWLALGSFGLRSGICLAGLFWIAREGRWEHVVSSLLGLLAARWVLVHLLRPARKPERSLSEG